MTGLAEATDHGVWNTVTCKYETPGEAIVAKHKNQPRVYKVLGDDDVIDLSFIAKVHGVENCENGYIYNIYFQDGTSIYMSSASADSVIASRRDLINAWSSWHQQNTSYKEPVV